jgi:hypothetical protein
MIHRSSFHLDREALARLAREGHPHPADPLDLPGNSPVEVERLDFDVVRVWQVGACYTPGCCPGVFLIDAGDGDFLFLNSWRLTTWLESESFQGRHVTLILLTASGRVGFGTASGACVPYEPEDLGDSWFDSPSEECVLLPSFRLPPCQAVLPLPPNPSLQRTRYARR